MNSLIFGEFVSSNNFYLHLLRIINIINQWSYLGIYNQGVPIPIASDFIWGTNAGVRTLPITLFLLILQTIFSSHWQEIYLLIILVLPFICMTLSLRMLEPTKAEHILAAIFFSYNTWIIDRIFSGFWQLNIVYSFLPFLIVIPLIITDSKITSKRRFLYYCALFALFLSLILIAQPHFIIMVTFFYFALLVKYIFWEKKTAISLLTLFIVSFTLCAALNIYIFVPGIFYSEPMQTAANQYFSLASVKFNGQGTHLFDAITFLPRPYPFNPHTWSTTDIILFFPIIIILCLFVVSKPKRWIFFISFLVFIFLSKGLNPPLEILSITIYEKLPIMHFFRDPPRFLAGAVLFGAFIIAKSHIPISKSFRKIGVITIVILLLLPNFHNLNPEKLLILKKTSIPSDYYDIQQYINNNLNNNYRLIALPNEQLFTTYNWYANDTQIWTNTVFDLYLPLSVPLANSNHYPDTYSNQASSFFYYHYLNSDNIETLAPLGVKYLLKDNTVPLQSASKSAIIKLDTQKLKRKYYNSTLSLYEINNSSQITTSLPPIFTVGNYKSIADVYTQNTKRPIILLNHPYNITDKHLSYLKNEDLYLESDNDYLEILTAEKLAPRWSVDVLKEAWNYDKFFVNYEPSKLQYIKENGQLFTSGRSFASFNTTGSMDIPVKLERGEYIVLLKAMTVESPSELILSTKSFSKNIIVNSPQHLQWQRVFSFKTKDNIDNISLTKNDKANLIVDYLLIIPQNDFISTQKNISTVIRSMNHIELNEIKNHKSTAKFNLDVDDVHSLSDQKYLTYRFSYGKHWQSDSEAVKFLSDGYGMTFIAKNHLSRISYFPNLIYHISLAVSFIILLSMVAYLLYFKFILNKK